MRIYVNRKAVKGPWGGENSFLGALCDWLTERGHEITIDRSAEVDVALLNALTQIDLDWVKVLHSRNVPIVHRKVGFIVSGSKEIRAVHNGVVEGDRRQIEFSPYIKHSIFQSQYSYETFAREGFEGSYSVIHNGVNTLKFNQTHKKMFGLREYPRTFWEPGRKFKVLLVSWSSDPAKGFGYYQEIDKQIAGRDDVEFTFVGRLPEGVKFQNIKSYKPQNHKKLAEFYRSNHALLFLGREETCSNTILEGINSGLAIIYHPSGASPETASPYGCVYDGNIFENLEYIQSNYSRIVNDTKDNPYKIDLVAPKYEKILLEVCGQR